VANRPGFLDAASVVEPGRLHLESGGTYASIHAPSDESVSAAAPMLLRIGLGHGWELRLTDGLTRRGSGSDVVAGVIDASVGVVRQLSTAHGYTPAAIALVETSLPSGSRALRGRGVQPNARVSLSWGLPGHRTINVGGGASWLEHQTGHEVVALGGVSVGQSLSARLSAFGEVSSASIRFTGVPNPLVARTGLAVLLTPDLQLDVDIAKGLRAADRGVQLAAGFALRR
jgi:hypothetical protein